MTRRVDDADPVLRVFEERLARRHVREDAVLSLDPEIVVDAAPLRHQTDERFRLVRVELVEHEDPGAIRVAVNRPGDVGREVVLGSRGADAREDGLSCHHVEVRDEAQRAVALVFELDALGLARSRRLRRVNPFECLNAGLLVGADDVPPCGSQARRVGVRFADLAHIGLVLPAVLQLVLGG